MEPKPSAVGQIQTSSPTKRTSVLSLEHDFASALTDLRRAHEIMSRLAPTDPGDIDWKRGLALPHNQLGTALAGMGNRFEAHASYQTSLIIWNTMPNVVGKLNALSSDRAVALDPDLLRAQAYRAHALLFRGHYNEASDLYLSHKAKVVPNTENRVWEVVISDDFSRFRRAGLQRFGHQRIGTVEDALWSP